VRDDNDRAAEFVAEALERPQHRRLASRVELRRRLVGEHERCLPSRRCRNRDALLLAAGERSRPLPLARVQVERVESVFDGVTNAAAAPCEAQAERHVVADAQRRPEVPVLEDDRDAVRAMLRELAFTQPRKRASEDEDVAR
jgi:hypothetical protein